MLKQKNEPNFKWWEGGINAMLDQLICSCGWESATYYDGREYAISEWRRHLKEVSHPPKEDSCQPSSEAISPSAIKSL